ncbi:MAG: rRNA pseudouridine synthase [Butyricicoccus sp.]|nr:rRNA pseudouridine synthase [Butyricicoccus sp.]
MPERLDKLIAGSGAATRSQAKALVRQGRVSVNGVPASSCELRLDPDTDVICLDGERLNCSRYRYFMLHKPLGLLSATGDREQETVLDLLPENLRRLRLFPVGRLDKDTSGLLILTNNGQYAHNIISPARHVPKRYLAGLDARPGEDAVSAFARGIVLADGLECLPARLELLERENALVTVYEGKYHQVRRMFAAAGFRVLTLKRLSTGALELDPSLGPGQLRELSAEEARLVFR